MATVVGAEEGELRMNAIAATTHAQALPPNVDVLVVGGGPAGAMAAITAARAGLRVLLADRAAHPREKVCGCCLAPLGQQVLKRAGLGRVLEGARGVRSVHLRCRDRGVRVRREGTVVLSRGALDGALLRQALAAGVTLAWPFTAHLHARRTATLLGPGGERSLQARLRVVADGLGGTALRDHPHFAWSVRSDSRMGLGAILPADALQLLDEEILMCVHREGYAGAVRLPDGRLDVAAAVCSEAMRTHGGAAACMRRMLGDSVRSAEALTQARWHGTPHLWRRRAHLHDANTLVAGDAAGYVEPFTGEGMGWALATGAAAGEHAAAVLRSERTMDEWDARVRAITGPARTRCGLMAWLLRHPSLVSAGIRAAAWWPLLAARTAESLGSSRSEACRA
jgi:flavin-dependent dehydrogenase